MGTETASQFWWLKSSQSRTSFGKNDDLNDDLTSTPKQTEDPSTISSSLKEFLERERAVQSAEEDDTDIGSIIDEINKLAAQSPLGPYERDAGDRSIEEIMKEAEKLYLESSKSFEQLSARSRTSANLSVSFNDTAKSSPTPNVVSPLPLDNLDKSGESRDLIPNDDSYSDDFTNESEEEVKDQPIVLNTTYDASNLLSNQVTSVEVTMKEMVSEHQPINEEISGEETLKRSAELLEHDEEIIESRSEERVEVIERDKETIQRLQEENEQLKTNIKVLKQQLEETGRSLSKAEEALKSDSPRPSELSSLNEELKDSKERNAALQLQFDCLNKSHQLLKVTYEELVISNSELQKRLLENESTLRRYQLDLQNNQSRRDKVLQNESNLSALLEVERLQVKNLKAQSEKDARCIQDLNRQVKEMERIIARKHPDSVSALIVAAKNNNVDNTMSARKLLEDRIKNLEEEVKFRELHSSKIFLEVQEKFTEMKNKYESHIEDLEIHVNDLKGQLKKKRDTFDVYTQTILPEERYPVKEGKDASAQTVTKVQPYIKPVKKEKSEVKEETHLLATIRGLQADLAGKDKAVTKLQKDLDEARKTNKRLQKEREGSLKNVSHRPEFRSYPEKLSQHIDNSELEEELKSLRTDRDKMKAQLCKMEDDYQKLKNKRIYDLSALQHAHEEEITGYASNMTPLREQLELRQATINALQEQLCYLKKELEMLTTERDQLLERLQFADVNSNGNANMDPRMLHQEKLALLERNYQERECRLRSIIQGLAQKSGNLGCHHCSARQQQLIVYKNELDQLLATLRTLT